MNHIDPKFLARSKAAFRSEDQTTLADVKRLAEADTALTSTQRRDLVSALSRVEQLFQTPLEKLEASPCRMRELFASASPAQVGVSDKTFANIRSLVAKAVGRYGRPVSRLTKRIPIDPSWTVLLEQIEQDYHRQSLYRLATYCTVMRLRPESVTSETLLGLHAALEAEEVVKNPKEIISQTITNWNRAVRRVPDWPQHRLASPLQKEALAFPLTAFPTSFQADIATWQERMAHPDPLDEEAPARALRPATIEHRTYEFRQFASALVQSGHTDIESITSLHVLFELEAFKAALRYFLDRIGRTQRVHNMARTMRLVAKHYCRLDEPTLVTLEKICRKLDPGNRRQMTERNRRRLGQFDDPRNVARLLNFPEHEANRALAHKDPLRAAKAMDRAVAIALLIHCGLRISSLRTLELADFSWKSSGSCILFVPAIRTKSDRALEFELCEEVTVLLKRHLAELRPRLPGSDGPYLFPGPDGEARSKTSLAGAIYKAMRNRAGLEMNPHLFRHAIAKIAVEADPGAYLAVSRVLGHTTLDTTMGHYLGTESKAAGRHVDKLLTEAKSKAVRRKR
jgi:integrase